MLHVLVITSVSFLMDVLTPCISETRRKTDVCLVVFCIPQRQKLLVFVLAVYLKSLSICARVEIISNGVASITPSKAVFFFLAG